MRGGGSNRERQWANALLTFLTRIDQRTGWIMGALEDVTAKMDAIEAANVERGRKLAEDVAELKRLAEQQPQPQDFSAVLARMQAHADALAGEDVVPDFPATPNA